MFQELVTGQLTKAMQAVLRDQSVVGKTSKTNLK